MVQCNDCFMQSKNCMAITQFYILLIDYGKQVYYWNMTKHIQLCSTLSEETAHSNVYHHLSQQSSCITTAQQSLRWRYTVEWAIFSESVPLNGFIPEEFRNWVKMVLLCPLFGSVWNIPTQTSQIPEPNPGKDCCYILTLNQLWSASLADQSGIKYSLWDYFWCIFWGIPTDIIFVKQQPYLSIWVVQCQHKRTTNLSIWLDQCQHEETTHSISFEEYRLTLFSWSNNHICLYGWSSASINEQPICLYGWTSASMKKQPIAF